MSPTRVVVEFVTDTVCLLSPPPPPLQRLQRAGHTHTQHERRPFFLVLPAGPAGRIRARIWTRARGAALRGALRSLTAAAAAAHATAAEGRIGQFHFGNEVHARASSMVFGRLAMNASHSAWSGWLSECDARFTLMFSSTLG